jgi:hypothetical protein
LVDIVPLVSRVMFAYSARGDLMTDLIHFMILVITTMFAAGAAVLVNWLLLRATFELMRPATVGRSASHSASTAGAAQVIRTHPGRR